MDLMQLVHREPKGKAWAYKEPRCHPVCPLQPLSSLVTGSDVVFRSVRSTPAGLGAGAQNKPQLFLPSCGTLFLHRSIAPCPSLLQRLGGCCPFVSSKVKTGRAPAGGPRCPWGTLGSMPWAQGGQPEGRLKMWTQNMGWRSQQVKIDFSSPACPQAPGVGICCLGASLTHAFLSVLLQR